MAAPAPDASPAELCQALGQAQVSFNCLQEELIKMRNKLNEFMAKKYAYFYHLWVPSAIFPLHACPPNFDLCDPIHYQTPESKAIANSAELYLMVPPELQAQTMKYEHFEQLISEEYLIQQTIANYCLSQFTSMVNGKCGNILKPVKDSVMQLFAHLSPGLDLVALGNWRKRTDNLACLSLLK
ncbi:hypothetical protein BKA82DRAFT_30564 [Pisolithus tinctorius]|uniref:Uncharacterized protein n=1 Tax=Pisolithus tinctorius Marx 270 TaxID=870435 RepID=A0A0C3NVY1_PISTI|nr:hypothetical protein BKA82DRAFT_30564 [Pisolithus tinctorius]KIN99333.1 hypothetical protein M404DRAFT_30564 [Pisolithus tinctorius Marx 270]